MIPYETNNLMIFSSQNFSRNLPYYFKHLFDNSKLKKNTIAILSYLFIIICVVINKFNILIFLKNVLKI